MTMQSDRLLQALRSLYRKGYRRISAQCLADELWPEARSYNAHGQRFNLASGIAGRMLRRYRGCHEVGHRAWEIVPEWIGEEDVELLRLIQGPGPDDSASNTGTHP